MSQSGSLVTTISPSHGGTGITSYDAGDMLYASSSTVLSKLPIGAEGQVLTVDSGLPNWENSPVDGVQSVSGTADRITSTGGTTPVLDIAATYVGQSSITTLGTVTSGVWHGTDIDLASYVSGNLAISHLNSGTSASSSTFWRGDGTWDTPAGTGVTSVTGTANRITSTGGTTPQIDISASYVGQSSITTLGTIGTGVWQGAAVGAVYGGTAQTTYATGDILYASAANTLSKLAAGSNTHVLTLAAGVPSWSAPATSYDVSNYSGGKTYTFDTYLPGTTSGDLGWSASAQNGGALTKGNLDSHLGTIECSTGVSTNGGCLYRLNGVNKIGGVAFKFGFYVKMPILSDGTDTFLVELGMYQAVFATTAISDGVYFSYTHGTNSGKWLLNNEVGNVVTPRDTGVTATTDWTYFEISVNAAGTSVSYFINGVETSNSPDTGNIPVGVDISFTYRLNKTAGTNARVLTGDSFYLITNP